ncbi:hypothetical protein [Nitrosomonas sp. Nm166]|uniref:hypothetical protein n=1 Tax=Nitrosomonas sp. Nm166 TaxID=1881054 RepID=UPI00116065E0|nr:hypothetical protein [Nitrosomonas sp. Nm166]
MAKNIDIGPHTNAPCLEPAPPKSTIPEDISIQYSHSDNPHDTTPSERKFSRKISSGNTTSSENSSSLRNSSKTDPPKNKKFIAEPPLTKDQCENLPSALSTNDETSSQHTPRE